MLLRVDQSDDFLHAPNVVTDARFHRRGDAEGLMDAPEVVIHVGLGRT